jgi:hypothetical protein
LVPVFANSAVGTAFVPVFAAPGGEAAWVGAFAEGAPGTAFVAFPLAGAFELAVSVGSAGTLTLANGFKLAATRTN